MNSKPVLMIHEVQDWMFDFPLENYILTFDDGLYSQYYYADCFARFDTEKIYFISSGTVCKKEQHRDFVDSITAHQRARDGDFGDYMTVDQIRELARLPNCRIGAHGHTHFDLKDCNTLFEKVTRIQQDTDEMVEWFLTSLGYVPTAFCYPFNNDLGGLYKGLLAKFGFTEFYGSERLDINNGDLFPRS